MTPSQLTAILRQIDSFPPLPLTVSRVLEVTSHPESSAADLMQAVLPDQSMCTAILKIANSAFFGRPRQVASIEEAVVVLGFDEIRNIILSQAIFTSFQKLSGASKKDIDALWLHALTCGLTARIIGASGIPSGQLFIAGLIHDIGKLPMLMALPGSYTSGLEHPEQIRQALFPDEEEKFGISHDLAGLHLLNRWLFPEQLCVAAGYHHQPQIAPSNRPFALVIQMADILSHAAHAKSRVTGAEIMQLIDDFLPNTRQLWEQSSLAWQATDIDSWLHQLQTELNTGACLHLFDE